MSRYQLKHTRPVAEAKLGVGGFEHAPPGVVVACGLGVRDDVEGSIRRKARAEGIVGVTDLHELDLLNASVGVAPLPLDQLHARGGLKVDDGVRAAGQQLGRAGYRCRGVRAGPGEHRSHLNFHHEVQERVRHAGELVRDTRGNGQHVPR